ncbi:uncharacterized protein LOC124887741 [Capsicum annuum]|uniref:uncharacterized protein LOC124887741 n=1 Tax=Capsicum annuum TaxID=4072 RepID=UPI001FB1839F|nr:uncharacterized protein LOC124887741 [Capsicum annuum]
MCKLLEKKAKFEFGADCHKAFEKLKKKLMKDPILIAPDWELPFEIIYDASDVIVGAVMVDYVSKWVKAMGILTNDARVVMKFVNKNIFSRFGMPRAIISDGGIMESESSKGKANTGPSAPVRKRSKPSKGKLTRVPRALPLQRGSSKILPGLSVGKSLIKDVTEEDGKEKEKEVVVKNLPRPQRPFPQRLKKKVDDTKFDKFMAILNQLMINVPLVEELEKIPGYAKFMKDLVIKKIAVSYEPKDNIHYYSVISTRSLVKKKADRRAFTILCTIRSLNFAKALCDLGESINSMPLAVNKMLVLGDPTPTNMWLVIKDRSVKWPVGILQDVLVKMANFILPADFVVLDCDVDFKGPIILGRTFLATRRVVVDIELNELKFRINNKEARFEMQSSMTQQKEMSVFSIVDVLYEDGKEVVAWCLDEI